MTDVDRIAETVTELVHGWDDRVEYMERVTVHTSACLAYQRLLKNGDPTRDIPPEPGRAKHHRCHCPQRVEARAYTRHQPGLIPQLAATHHAPVDDTVVTTAQPTSHPPGSLEPLALLDAILAATAQATDQLHAAAPHTPPPRSSCLSDALGHLVTLAAHATHDPDTIADVLRTLRRLRRHARITLGYDAPKRTLRDVVCGECAGRLVVSADATSDVVCTGTEDNHGCGTRYRRFEWIDLLDQDPNHE